MTARSGRSAFLKGFGRRKAYIIRNMQKALQADGLERDPLTFQIHDGAPETPIVDRVLDKHVTDELSEHLTIVVDGIEGRTHHFAGIAPERLEDARIGGVVQIGPAEATARPSDRAIAAIAEDGIYRPSRRKLLATLREREVARVGAEMAASKGVPFRSAPDGETVSNKFIGAVQLSSGKFAVVEKSQEFTLVPWRPVIDRQLGREVMGVVQGGSVSWRLRMSRDVGIPPL